ncbi:MAG: Uma2 family endonuclease [Euzebya sp.]
MTALSDATMLSELPSDAFRPLRRAEFQALVDTGTFDGTHVELVGGVLVEMGPQGEQHSETIRRLTKLLVHAVGDDYDIGVQTPLAVDDITLPEPDLQVLPAGPYWTEHPDRALLVIEVSRSSLRFDLGVKARRYAAADYTEYWVVDLDDQQIHVHTGPSADGWSRVDVITDGVLASSAVPSIRVPLARLFAERPTSTA